jgi:hypothetical protein
MTPADKRCETCGMWVAYNSVFAGRGECCLPMQPNPPVKVGFVLTPKEPTVFLTAWDYGCVRWVQRPVAAFNQEQQA